MICGWNYPGEYAIYNLPPYEEMKKKGFAFGNPDRDQNFYSFEEDGELIGFVNILEEENEVFLGIGVHPAYCGRGYGQKIVSAATQISKEKYPGKPLYLEVRTWNERAVRCYKKAGFQIDGEPMDQETSIGAGSFYRMIKNV